MFFTLTLLRQCCRLGEMEKETEACIHGTIIVNSVLHNSVGKVKLSPNFQGRLDA